MITVQNNDTKSINVALQAILQELESLKSRIAALEKKLS